MNKQNQPRSNEPSFDTSLFDEVLLQWQPHRHLANPPPEPIRLWQSETREVLVADAWGPPLPYGPRDHGDGHKNYGYVSLKGDAFAVSRLPEVEGWPELEEFLVTINAAASPIESAGCEKGYFPAEIDDKPVVQLGSYVDVVFTDARLNDRAENLLLLASHLMQAVAGCERWWAAVEIRLTRFKFVPGPTGLGV